MYNYVYIYICICIYIYIYIYIYRNMYTTNILHTYSTSRNRAPRGARSAASRTATINIILKL